MRPCPFSVPLGKKTQSISRLGLFITRFRAGQNGARDDGHLPLIPGHGNPVERFPDWCYPFCNSIGSRWSDSKAIPPQRPSPLLTFLCKIVRNLSIMRHHANTARKRNSTYDIALEELEGCLSSPTTVEEELETRGLTCIIDRFLETLSQENRVIFLRRYWFSDTYKQIAQRIGVTENTIAVRLTRMRKQLKNDLTEREISI